MSQRVLVFDSDAAFAADVKENFERLGLSVDIANDGPSGLELASSNPPQLILLAIELPGMNGFLVCKKLKKIAELEHVPLVIMSSEVDQETFEQHKKLRTRADDYIRKPIAFPELFERVRNFVASNGYVANGRATTLASRSARPVHAYTNGDADGLDIEAAFRPSDEPPHGGALPVNMATEPDAELLALSGALPSDSALPIGGNLLPPIAVPEHELGAQDREAVPSLRSVSQQVNMRSSSNPPFLESAAAAAAHASEVERFRRELASAEEKVHSADQRAAFAEQRATGAEKALDAAKRTGGASSRELLDLREQLNRKDRELLELRDQITSRDKQLIEASDRHLAVERALQDLRENHSDLQRELEKKSELVIALTGDKETARKRLEDTKARAERNEQKVKELSTAIDDLRVSHQLEVDSLNGTHSEAMVQLRSEHVSHLEQQKQQHGAEQQALAEKHRHDIAERSRMHAGELAALNEQHSTLLADREQTHKDELTEVREEYAVAQKAAATAAEQEKAAALEVLRDELNAAHYEKLTDTERELRAEHAAERQELDRQQNTALAEVAEKHRQEMLQLNKALSDASARYASLEEQQEDTERARLALDERLRMLTDERDALNGRGVELADQLTRVQARADRDNELIDRVRKAMAIGLGLLEEQKHEPAS
jgi:CheY-like chemotaxis protein